jgi:hypothetical protein
MTRDELFDTWVPEDNLWTPWGKPVLFAEMDIKPPPEVTREPVPPLDWASGTRRCVIILDLPGADSVYFSIELARRGFRPVPLFNAATSPWEIIDLKPVTAALQRTADELNRIRLSPDAPPVFLLDSRRQDGKQRVRPGAFDNRWLVFPQDFPSANFLLSREIREAILVQEQRGQPLRDLSHVLRRWQDAGISIQQVTTQTAQVRPAPLTVQRPSHFRALWYRSLAIMGFKRNSAGGFGALIPEQGGSTSGFG